MFKRGQAILEYVVLIAVVAAALVGMHTYVFRSVNARLKQVQEEVTSTYQPGLTPPTDAADKK